MRQAPESLGRSCSVCALEHITVQYVRDYSSWLTAFLALVSGLIPETKERGYAS